MESASTESPARPQSNTAAAASPQDGEADDEDSSSEMDVSMSSRASSPERAAGQEYMPNTGLKRKLSGTADDSASFQDGTQDPNKRPRLSPTPEPVPYGSAVRLAGPYKLPVELWQQVFLYLPPAMLCRCLSVCRMFNSCLTSAKAETVVKKDQPRIRVLDSETIWTHARKAFFPNLPRPLSRCTELEMLQLIGGRTCQFCHREPVPLNITTIFNCGPGPDGVRVIWPLGIRACGRCIENNTVKVSD